jgi:hypothetical protein
MASGFDINHETGHFIAGLLGFLGFPIAALLLSAALRRNTVWRRAGRTLFQMANLDWISVVLLVVTVINMTMPFAKVNGGHLLQHPPKSLPPGVLGLDGWADRLMVLSNCVDILLLRSRRFDGEANLIRAFKGASHEGHRSRDRSSFTDYSLLRNGGHRHFGTGAAEP